MPQMWWVIGWLLLMVSPLWAGTVHLAWDASRGAQGYELHYGLAPGSYTEVVDTGVATSASLTGLTTGQLHYFAALAYNSVGDSSYSNEVSAVPSDPPPADTTPPASVSITSPANGATVPRNTNLTISAEASDNVGVTRVDFRVNGTLICSDGTSPYACSWHVPAPPNRTYTLMVEAFDAAGNRTPVSIQVTT